MIFLLGVAPSPLGGGFPPFEKDLPPLGRSFAPPVRAFFLEDQRILARESQ